MELVKNREGFLVGKTHRECTSCKVVFNITSKTVTICGVCNSERVKATSEISKMLLRAKNRAKQKHLDFNLDATDIFIPVLCPILGLKLANKKGKPGGSPNSPALDRIDNSKGYVKGNVCVISHLANMMKSSATDEQLIKFAFWISTVHIPGKNVTSLVEHN